MTANTPCGQSGGPGRVASAVLRHAWTLSRQLDRACSRLRQSYLLTRRTKLARRAVAAFAQPYRLHIGCGNTRLEGWVNVDLHPKCRATTLRL